MNIKHPAKPAPSFQPIKLERVAEKVASQLKDAIVRGAFRIGERLPSERDLATQMGVSRASVREAIQQLEMLGMVESIHGGGTVVQSLAEKELGSPIEALLQDDVHKVVELTEVRALLEAWAARQAALNRTDEQLQRMRSLLAEMREDLARGRIRSDIDLAFHTEIAAAAHNTIFLHLMQTIHRLISYSIKLSRELFFLTEEYQEVFLDHHTRVFQAIERGMPDLAETAMREHLSFVVAEYRRRFLS